MLSFTLASKLLRRVISEAPTPLHKLIRAILFNIRSWFFDLFYFPLSKKQLSKLLDDFKRYLEEYCLHYENELFDCDDFALAFKHFATVHFKTNAVGVALGMLKKDGKVLGGHAWNVVLLGNGNIVYVEPQTCEIIYGNVSLDGFEYELQAVVW